MTYFRRRATTGAHRPRNCAVRPCSGTRTPRRWLPWAIVLGALAFVALLPVVVLATRSGDGPEPRLPPGPTPGPVEPAQALTTDQLPGGVSWDFTYADLVAGFGEAQLEGGWGTIDCTAHHYGDGRDYAFGLSGAADRLASGACRRCPPPSPPPRSPGWRWPTPSPTV